MQKFDIRHSFEHFWEVHVEAWHAHLKTLGIEKRQGPSAAVEGVGVEVG
jgi:hypothetical protein